MTLHLPARSSHNQNCQGSAYPPTLMPAISLQSSGWPKSDQEVRGYNFTKQAAKADRCSASAKVTPDDTLRLSDDLDEAFRTTQPGKHPTGSEMRGLGRMTF